MLNNAEVGNTTILLVKYLSIYVQLLTFTLCILPKYLYFLLLTFSKQAHYFRFKTTEGSFYFTAAFKHLSDLSLNGGNSNTEK